MRKLSVILFVLFIAQMSIGQVATDAIASCCSSKKGRCLGSANCTVCTDCSRCGHCNSGGSCGVCSGKKTNRTYYYTNEPSTSSTTKSYNNGIYNLPDNHSSQYYMKTLIVDSETLNLRKGPSTSYEIIQKLKENQELIFLAMIGDWVKIKVKSNGIIGFVHYKYVAVMK